MKSLPSRSERPPAHVGRRRCLRLALGLGTLAGAPARAVSEISQEAALHWQQRMLLGFGTSLWLRAAHRNPAHLRRALDAAVNTIRHVERQMSLFDSASAVSQLNRNGELRDPDGDLLAALALARSVSARSAGAFDITVQPLWQTWAHARARDGLPTADALRRAVALVDWRGVELDAGRIAFDRPGMGVTLNGIAQGYAADRVREVLSAHEIEHALLDTGEWAPMGLSPQQQVWRLGLQHPADPGRMLATVIADGRAIATSSDANYVFSEDRRHHHILDPRTGLSPAKIASLSVAAPSCALADALTKVLFMGSVGQAMSLATDWGVDVLAVGKDGQWQASPGMPLTGPVG